MDFYYGMTNYHVLCCLLHKMCVNKENKGILYVSSYLRYNQPNIVKKIKESKIFEEVHYYEELEFVRTPKNMNNKELVIEINRICEEVEKTVGKILKNVNNIYVCSDFYSIGVYLVCNKIKYNYFEDGCGTLSKHNLPLRIIEKDNPNRAKIVKKFKLIGNNKNVISRYGNLSVQEEGYYNSKDINFNVEKMLKKLDNKQLKKILDIYDVKKINVNKKTNMLLTLHYNEIFSMDEQKNIYLTLLDYFSKPDEKIIVKPHPADSIIGYEKIIKGSKEINRYMPSELIPFCINKKFNKGITCWSTSIYGMKNILNKIVNFDERIDKTYKDFDKYYAIVEYLKLLKSNNKYTIVYRNINDIQFKRLFEMYFSNYEEYYSFDEKSDNEKIYIVDKITTDIENEMVISFEYNNSKKAIFIDKKKINQNEKKFISVYNIDSDIKMDINKKLKYSNLELKITYLDESKQKEELFRIIKDQNKVINNNIKIHEQEVANLKDVINNKINTYEQEIAILEDIITKKEESIQSIYNSSSWKITKPIRKVVDLLRKKRNK